MVQRLEAEMMWARHGRVENVKSGAVVIEAKVRSLREMGGVGRGGELGRGGC